METLPTQALPTATLLAQQKADALKRSADGTSAKEGLSDSKKAEYAKVARGFESMFVHEMYKQMRSAMLDEDDGNEEDMTFGSDVLEGYAGMQFADQVSQSGTGMGLAQMVYKNLTGEESLPSIITQRAIQPKDSFESLIPQVQSLKKQDSTSTLSHKPAQQESATTPVSGGNLLSRVARRLENVHDTIALAAAKYNVPEPLIRAVITAESAGNAQATSPVGARGLMQLMDGTAREMNVRDSYNPHENIMGGTKYLRKMLDTFDGNLDKTIASYNAGPGNVKKYDGIPPFKETQAYVKKVKRYLSHYSVESAE